MIRQGAGQCRPTLKSDTTWGESLLGLKGGKKPTYFSKVLIKSLSEKQLEPFFKEEDKKAFL
jgi:hypothetical protein